MAIACALAICQSAALAEFVPFVLPWDDASAGPTDLSAALAKPAGKNGFVHIQDGRLYEGNQRLKLFGVNFTAAACFPEHDTSDKTAARLAKFGFNAARLHFLDATWGTPSLIRYGSGSWQSWDTNALDCLDYFIAALKKHGIYINLNLLVGREFGVGDGVDSSISELDWKAAHAIGFFHRPHLAAQKEYARRLLTHINPYTGKSYAEDAAIALVEINNENGLIHTWLAGELDSMPEVFEADLKRQWNNWLAQRYKSAAALHKAWGFRDEPPGPELLKNSAMEHGLKSWVVEQHEGAKVTADVVKNAAVLRVEAPGAQAWHVQFNQPGIKVKKGGLYTATFAAAADTNREISLCLMQAHAPWRNLAGSTAIKLTTEEQLFSFTFVVEADDENARLNFSGMNQAAAEFRFARLSFKAGGRIGLRDNETIEAKNVPVFAKKQLFLSEGMRLDWIKFLWETEREYWREMNCFLKQELSLQQPVVGTSFFTSTPYLMNDLDVIDSHAYWEHPRFPGKPWDSENWLVDDVSMADAPARATITRLACQRIAGKPFMVSEYNHPAPNTHAAEGPLFLAACGAMQDWDGIFLYTYSHNEADIKAGRISGFFDIAQHPAIMANAAVASIMFRSSGHAEPALTVPLTQQFEQALIAKHGRDWLVLPIPLPGMSLTDALEQPVAIEIVKTSGQPSRAAFSKPGSAAPAFLAWHLAESNQGLFEFHTPKVRGFIGRADGKTIDLRDGINVTINPTANAWCTFALAQLDSGSNTNTQRRSLLVTTGHIENTGMVWKNPERSSLSNWGSSPTMIEPVAAVLQAPFSDKPPILTPLDERGQRGRPIPFTPSGKSVAQVSIGPPHNTLWYEIQW